MKKVSSYLIIVVVLGLAFVGYWIYQRYMLKSTIETLSFDVVRGDIQETVTARGSVAPMKDLDLEFPYSETIISVSVRDGQRIRQGDILMTLNTRDLELEKSRLLTTKIQSEAKLAKLIFGSTLEDIKVTEEKVSSARALLEDAKKTLSNKIRDAYINADDAVRSKADALFEGARSSSPKFIYTVSDQQMKVDAEADRRTIETMLGLWQASTLSLAGENLSEKSAEAKDNIITVSYYLDKVSSLVNSLTVNQSLSQTSIDTFKTNVATGRTNTASASTALIAGIEKLNTADSALKVSIRELEALKSPARDEDVAIAKAEVAGIISQTAQIEEKIRKSVLVSPVDGEITEVWFERGEFYNVGKPAVSISSSGYKIESDVSELEIRKVSPSSKGEDVVINLDAYPGETFYGKVATIESKPVIKDGDVYYRVIVTLPDTKLHEIRTGMSADIKTLGKKKNAVLKVPELAVYKKGQGSYVYVSPIAPGVERLVVIGISDGESIEVVSGLKEGEKIYIKPE